jgi:MATE family multidrug resistance protein
MLLVVIYHFFDGLQVTCAGILAGYKVTRFTSIVSFFAFWIIGLPGGYILGMTNWIAPAMSTRGFFYVFILAMMMGSSCMFFRVLYIGRSKL